ncbi:MAG: SpoIIE family protein phosphatase [Bacteroidota bacterium]
MKSLFCQFGCLLFALLWAGNSYAQIENDTTALREGLDQTQALADDEEWGDVLALGQEVLEGAQRNNFLEVEAEAYFILAKANQALGLEGATLVNLLGAERVYTDLQNIPQRGYVHWAMAQYYVSIGGYGKAAENYQKARQELPVSDRALWQGPTLKELAEAYDLQGDGNQALTTYEQLRQHYLTQGEKEAEYRITLKLADLAYQLGQKQAMQRYTEALLRGYESQNDAVGMSTAFNNLGFLYQRNDDSKTAIEYFDRSVELIQTLNPKDVPIEDLAQMWINAGVAYVSLGLETRAEEYYRKALKMYVEAEDLVGQAKVFNYLAASSYVNGKPLNAREEVDNAIKLAEPLKAEEVLVDSYRILALLFNQAGNNQKAQEYQELQRDIARKLRDEATARRQEQRDAQRELDQEEQSLRQQLLAQRSLVQEQERQENQLLLQQRELALLQQQEDLRQSELRNQQLEADRATRQLALAQQTLEAERQQAELARLEQQRKEQEAELERQAERQSQQEVIQQQELATLQAQNDAQTAELERQKAARRYAIIGGILGLLVILVLIISFRSKQRDNQKLQLQQMQIQEANEELRANQEALEESNDQLAQKNKSITSSITYAQRIQEAMLPSQFVIREHLPDSFILFRPRDIVSGDFFWFAEKDDHIFIAAVDCTGHGVPGAFMSMIGTQLLNDLVNKRGLRDSDAILDELHEEVKRALKQEQTQNNDGMDMALCVIHKEDHTVQFSGAKNPLIFVRNGEIELIKGDRYPIGGSQIGRRQPYQKHTLELDSETTFYIYSDGFQDQYGGPDNRKFMTKHFRALLHRIHDLPMRQQQKELESALEEWKGQQSQVDDILVMGFRLQPKVAGQKGKEDQDERAA